MVRSALFAFLLSGMALPQVHAGAFFAMDTGVTGTPEEVAATLESLGYDGLGGSGTDPAPMLRALEAHHLELSNVYLTLELESGKPVMTPELQALVAGLKGRPIRLWLAISRVVKDGRPLAVSAPQGDEIVVAAVKEITGQGVGVSLYPHTGHWLERFGDAVRLAEKIGRPDTGVTFNLCHWLKVEGDADPLPAIRAAKARLQFVTLNGADGGDTRAMNWDRLIQPLGQGSYDTAGFVRRLQAEWDGPIGLQGYGIGGDRKDHLKRSIAAWRTMQGTLDGLVLCGYQGWFRCGPDGAGNGWHHYAPGGKFEPGSSAIEMWPDVSELGPDERFATAFRHADGSVAEVFSSTREPTVKRHFRWMKDYGIDGVFIQRFASTARDPRFRGPMDRILGYCQQGAAAEGRQWALMYDLSGLKEADFPRLIEDWQGLVKGGLWSADSPTMLRYRGRPLVALWGLGFNDRPPALEGWAKLLDFFRSQNVAIMVGVPCYWRTLDHDTHADPKLHELIAKADLVSPWAVGRFGTPEEAAARRDRLLKPDLAWCRERGLGYLPVAFPGFSWRNLQKSRGQEARFEAIPRRGGKFLWSQALAARQAGNHALYIAMFDEMDEGTAIFKTDPNPPVGESRFLAEPGIPSDHYLWLTGQVGRLMRSELGSTEMPARAGE